MKKTRGLGRGLDALLGDDNTTSENHGELQQLGLEKLQPGKYQPRSYMDEESLNSLAASIKAQGLMQPILVRAVADDKWEIIAGERRWRAAKIAGLFEVPVLIKTVADDAALAMALIENIQREDLNPIEEALGIQRLIEQFQMTHQVAADAVGRSRSAVTNLLRLLNLATEVQDLVMTGKLEMGHARSLLVLEEIQQVKLSTEIVSKSLTTREVERRVKEILEPKPQIVIKVNRDVVALEETLSDKVGAKVTITSKKNGSGRLVIEYDNFEHLDSLINRL
ncbi:ParB/RepB/Spo0J family partition protein [Sulfuriferula nivalis]|uniref:Chromosome partitioning protein ParB n=1 Tax=Sulfuriferula nivalis TaxID=2675298 RepID=A0A809SBR1_9PROT|nr:ParB/RepB/Spo0J family partition protein [Sulfuriferula nivalis]BBP02492.1 chromosome partitioning protein ParB [Sulfuriferula nivalis]